MNFDLMKENQRITDEERKDILIAWAYRYLSEQNRIAGNPDHLAFPSQIAEFRSAARCLVPDVEALSETCHYHADIAALKGREEPEGDGW